MKLGKKGVKNLDTYIIEKYKLRVKCLAVDSHISFAFNAIHIYILLLNSFYESFVWAFLIFYMVLFQHLLLI